MAGQEGNFRINFRTAELTKMLHSRSIASNPVAASHKP
jgi:hypothetical protein